MKRPIGLFDSGLGGLTILKALSRALPFENFIYLGDSQHLPFGEKPKEKVLEYSLNCSEFLLSQNIKLLVVACHTASTLGIEKIQNKVNIPVVGLVEPTKKLLENPKPMALLATKNTIESNVYQSNRSNIFPIQCPLFVHLIEEGHENQPEAKQIAQNYLAPLLKKIEGVVLACTHFPFMEETLKEVLGPSIALFDPSELCAKLVLAKLTSLNLLNTSQELPSYKFFTSDDPEKFHSQLKRLWNLPIESVGKKQEFMKLFLKTNSISVR